MEFSATDVHLSLWLAKESPKSQHSQVPTLLTSPATVHETRMPRRSSHMTAVPRGVRDACSHLAPRVNITRSRNVVAVVGFWPLVSNSPQLTSLARKNFSLRHSRQATVDADVRAALGRYAPLRDAKRCRRRARDNENDGHDVDDDDVREDDDEDDESAVRNRDVHVRPRRGPPCSRRKRSSESKSSAAGGKCPASKS